MATYRIKVTGMGSEMSATRKRSDAALMIARDYAYDAIASQAGLDTPWGHKAMHEVETIDPQRGKTVTIGTCVLFFTFSRW